MKFGRKYMKMDEGGMRVACKSMYMDEN